MDFIETRLEAVTTGRLIIEEPMEKHERLGLRAFELLKASTVVDSKRHSKVGTRLTWARDIQMEGPDRA